MSDEVFRGQYDAGKLVLVGKGRDEIIELLRLVGLRVNELRSGDNNQAGSDSGQAQSVHSEFTFRIQTDDTYATVSSDASARLNCDRSQKSISK